MHSEPWRVTLFSNNTSAIPQVSKQSEQAERLPEWASQPVIVEALALITTQWFQKMNFYLPWDSDKYVLSLSPCYICDYHSFADPSNLQSSGVFSEFLWRLWDGDKQVNGARPTADWSASQNGDPGPFTQHLVWFIWLSGFEHQPPVFSHLYMYCTFIQLKPVLLQPSQTNSANCVIYAVFLHLNLFVHL